MNQEDLLIFTKDNIEEDKKNYRKTDFSVDYLNTLIINVLFDVKDSFKGKSKTLLINEFKERIQKGYEVKLDDEAFRNYFINNNDFKVIDDKISLVNINDFFLKNIHLDLDKFEEWGPHNNLDDLLLMYANSVHELGITDNKSVALIFIMRYKQEQESYEELSQAFFKHYIEEFSLCNFSYLKYNKFSLIPINAVIKSNLTRQILFINGITYIRDFKKYSNREVENMLIASKKSERELYCTEWSMTKFYVCVELMFMRNDDSTTQKIIEWYNGFYSEPITLAEISKRIAMPIKEVLSRIDKFYEEFIKGMEESFGIEMLGELYSAFYKNSSYCYISDLEKVFKRPSNLTYDCFVPVSLCTKFFLSAINHGCYPIKYDKELDIIYDSTLTSLNNIVEEQLLKIGNIITVDELENLGKLEHKIIEKYYYKRTEKLFAKKGINDKVIIKEIYIKEVNNYEIRISWYNEVKYSKLIEYLNYQYGEGLLYPTFEEFDKLYHRDLHKIIDDPDVYQMFIDLTPYSLYDYIIDEEKYVRINDELFIKKEIFKIPNNKLEQIRKNVRLLVARFGEYNTKEIENHTHGYPHLSYPWNRYLLASIVSTYFSDEFETVFTEENYKKTDCVIKLKN